MSEAQVGSIVRYVVSKGIERPAIVTSVTKYVGHFSNEMTYRCNLTVFIEPSDKKLLRAYSSNLAQTELELLQLGMMRKTDVLVSNDEYSFDTCHLIEQAEVMEVTF